MLPTSPFNSSVLNVPAPTKEPDQRSLNISDLFLLRWTPPWSRPPSLPAYTWRAWVLNQPVATVCKETLIASLLSLDWKITPADMSYRDELTGTIRYYTKLLEHGGDYLGTDYTGLCEWILGDLLDLPFGAAAELGRKNDAPRGRVQWIRPLDGGTLYPTLNLDYPVVQYYQGYQAVAFPNWSIARTYLNPRSEIFREGWGMAPPEKVYFAIDLLTKGDKYYANLLLDIPPVGVFDLGDMEESSAKEWIEAFQTFTAGTTDSFKIPVLYEHTRDAKFIPFGKAPNDIMFDHITLKYAAMVAAAYGVSLNDIGLQTTSRSGETLAGAIRSERRTAKTGMARIKTKFKNFINTILPDTIGFDFIELDTETTMAMGRARLASATALNIALAAGILNRQEVRSQLISDGLITISIPEDLPKDAVPMAQGNPKERPGLLGYPTPPSQGGNGEIGGKSLIIKKSRGYAKNLDKLVQSLVTQVAPMVYESFLTISEDEIEIWKSVLSDVIFSGTDELGITDQINTVSKSKAFVEFKYHNLAEEIHKMALDRYLDNPDLPEDKKVALEERLNKVGYTELASELERNTNGKLNEFLAKSAVFLTNELIFGGKVEQEEQMENSEDVVDKSDLSHYDYIVTTIQEKMLTNLDDFINAHLVSETQMIMDKIGESIDG